MKRDSGLFLLVLMTALILVLLSGCNGTVTPTDYVQSSIQHNAHPAGVDDTNCDIAYEQADLTETIIFAESEDEYMHTESHYIEDGMGGPLWECGRHVWSFHDIGIFIGSGGEGWPAIVDLETARAWSFLQEELGITTGECHLNIHAFIQHFGISREAFQELIDGNIWWYFQYGGDTLDVLYSGNWALIDHFFSWEGSAYWNARAREDRYYNERIRELQQIVHANTTEMSWYFHDVWTYSHFLGGKSGRIHWMQGLIDAGEYDRINIVEFINHFGLYRPSSLSPGLTIFEHWARYHNMNIYTHYNFDVLLSNDWNRIREYYGIANEANLTAQVQARFNAYASAHGRPDTSWMISREHQLTFNLHGGVAAEGNAHHFDPQTIRLGGTATHPASNPIRENYQFVDWYTQATGGVPFDFSTRISENTIVYARWVVEPATPQDPPTDITPPSDTTLSPSPYIPWTPRTGTPDRAYTAYGDDNDDALDEAAAPPVFIPPPPSINTLIFTVGNIEYLLRNQPRTSVGAPFIDRATDRMMIPLRTLSEALDTEVEWCSDTRSALVHLPTGTLAIPADELLPDGMGSAIIVNDRIFIPLRFVMYAFDADVAWDSANRAAVIIIN